MKYAIISDLHSNLESLKEFFKFIPILSIERVVCLGDLVGYNANPNECIDLLRNIPDLAVIRGNHDKAAATRDFSFFSNNAAEAIRWTIKTLSSKNMKYLQGLKQGPMDINDIFTICHGSALDEDRYILSLSQARDDFKWLNPKKQRIHFFGHTHTPRIFKCDEQDNFIEIRQTEIELDPRFMYIINPGSLGQPRDGDPRAAFGLLDTDTREYRLIRFEYPLHKTKKKILTSDLPSFLASRLAAGR